MTRRVATLLAALFGVVSTARAQLDVGPEFQVNTYTTGPQRLPAVAVRADGSFVVAWESGASSGYPEVPGDSATGVFLQRFDAAGMPLGDEQHVNTFTRDDQMRPDVSARADGGFVVVWESGCYYGYPECGPDGSESAVALQRFDAAGVPQGGELIVNTFTPGRQCCPAVASAPTDAFVVTWASDSYTYPLPDRDPSGIAARRFAADGTPGGDELPANTEPFGLQSEPDVAMDGAGNFVVVWFDYVSTFDWNIHGRRFDASGAPLGEIEVTSGSLHAFNPAVAPVAGGGFVVAWQASYDEPQRRSEIRARRFAADGVPLGPAFAVNSFVRGEQYAPAVAADAAGNFVVTWTNYDYLGFGPERDSTGVFAQAFAHDGAPLGSEFQVNTFTSGFQNESAVGASAAGEFVVAWTSSPYYGATPQDGSGPGVIARRLALHPCGDATGCADANPCTTDACEGGVCLNRRQPGCCQSPAECWDGDSCTDDVCTGTVCGHAPIPECVPCVHFGECDAPDVCTTATCHVSLGRCEFTRIAGCCLASTECDDGLPCTEDVCGPGHACTASPIAGCVLCSDDAECATDCLINPPTCAAGRCESRPAGCPVVTIDPSDPFGAAGKLLVRLEIPADVPGKGKIKTVITAAVGTLDASDEPARRCGSGKLLGRVRAALAPASDTNVLLAFTKAGARCLAADPDRALPIEVTVRVKRKKTPLSESMATRIWRR